MWVYCKIPEDIGVRIRKAEGERIGRFTGFGFQTGEDWLCTPGLKRVFFQQYFSCQPQPGQEFQRARQPGLWQHDWFGKS